LLWFVVASLTLTASVLVALTFASLGLAGKAKYVNVTTAASESREAYRKLRLTAPGREVVGERQSASVALSTLAGVAAPPRPVPLTVLAAASSKWQCKYVRLRASGGSSSLAPCIVNIVPPAMGPPSGWMLLRLWEMEAL